MGFLRSIGDYFKRAEKAYWVILIIISGYSLLLLKTVPVNIGNRSWFVTMLIAILLGYVGAIIITMVDYHDISTFWYIISAG